MSSRPPVFDAHCDTLLRIESADEFLNGSDHHIDGPRLDGSDVTHLVTAICADAHRESRAAMEKGLELYGRLSRTYSGCRLLLGIEGCEELCNLPVLPQEIAVAGLTWNGSTSLGGGIGTDEGLTSKGRELAGSFAGAGVVLDVSHLCDRARHDLLSMGIRGTSATHCNCRGLFDHPRNLPDDDIREIAALGGVVGITFVPGFLRAGGAFLADIIDHLQYLIEVAGVEHAGFGSDFDGVPDLPEGITGCSSWGTVLDELGKIGLSEDEREMVACGNWRRVFGL
jgi:membrane dipeptidase